MRAGGAASFCLPDQPALVPLGPTGTLTSCQDLYFPRVSSQSPLVCPPKCHAFCQGERRGGSPPLPLSTVKETFVLPLCPLPLPLPLLNGQRLPGQLPVTGIALGNRGSEEGCGRLWNTGGRHPPPHPQP